MTRLPDPLLIHRALFAVRESHTEAGTTTVVASTDTSDSYDDVVDQGAWDLSRYKANPVILFGHDYGTPPVGMAVDVGVRAMGGEADRLALHAEIKWDTHADNDLGRLVGGQFERGFLKAVSVGFRSGKWTLRRELPEDHAYFAERGYLLSDNELLEISAVPIPANPEAVSASVKAAGLAPTAEALHAAVKTYLESPAGRLLIEASARAPELDLGLFGLPK